MKDVTDHFTRIFSERSSHIVKGYYIGKDIAFEDEQAGRSFMTPNIWPFVEKFPESVLKKPMVDYYEAVEAHCLRVLELIAAALPCGPDMFDELKAKPIVASMRFLRYPPQRSTAEKQFGAGAQADFGVITLLLTDGLPGLKVRDQKTGQCVSVPPEENAFVVNVGDTKQITGGYFKSKLHRGLNLGDADRCSVPNFFDGCLDARLKRFDGTDEDRILTVEEHMVDRFATTYSASRVG